MRCMWMYRRFFEDASSLPSFFDLNGKAIEQRTKEMNDLRDARKLAVITVVAVGMRSWLMNCWTTWTLTDMAS